MKTVEELYKYIATLHFFHLQIWEKYIGYSSKGDDISCSTKTLLFNIKREIRQAEEEVASFPRMKYCILPWMVDVCGNCCEVEVDSIERVSKDLDFENFINSCGSVAESVQNSIRSWGFKITDSGGGVGGWHVGVPCDDYHSEQLCSLLHKKFAYAIEKGYITVYKRFWGFKIKDLYNWDEVERWVSENGLDTRLYNKLIDKYEVTVSKKE